jgi:hypothetical protein
MCAQEGNFGPIKTEVFVEGLETEGMLPKELNGVYVRSKSDALQWYIHVSNTNVFLNLPNLGIHPLGSMMSCTHCRISRMSDRALCITLQETHSSHCIKLPSIEHCTFTYQTVLCHRCLRAHA